MNFCVGWMGILNKRPFISYTILDEHPHHGMGIHQIETTKKNR